MEIRLHNKIHYNCKGKIVRSHVIALAHACARTIRKIKGKLKLKYKIKRFVQTYVDDVTKPIQLPPTCFQFTNHKHFF